MVDAIKLIYQTAFINSQNTLKMVIKGQDFLGFFLTNAHNSSTEINLKKIVLVK